MVSRSAASGPQAAILWRYEAATAIDVAKLHRSPDCAAALVNDPLTIGMPCTTTASARV